MRTVVELQREMIKNIQVMSELGTVWSINRVANALGTSTKSAMTHCQLAELHGKVMLLKKERGWVVMPMSMVEKVKD